MTSAKIINLRVKRKRVLRDNRFDSNVRRIVTDDDQETVLIASSADSRDLPGVLLSSINSNSKRDPGNQNLRPKTFGLIEEILLATAESTSVRHFTGTDFDVAENRDGQYQYIVEIEVQDPIIKMLKNNLTILRRLIQGSASSPGFEEYYQDSLARKSYFDERINQFDVSFLAFYNAKYNTNSNASYDTESFLFKAISSVARMYFDFSSIGSKQRVNQVSILNYLTNIASPNSGSPDGIQKVLSLLKNLETQIDTMIQKNSRIPRFRGDVSDSTTARNTSVSSAKDNKTIKLDFAFDNIFDANTNPSVGYDYLFSTKNQMERNTDGLALLTKQDIFKRASLETSKYFMNQGSNIKIEDEDSVVYNDGDKLENSMYSFLTVSNIFLKQEDRVVTYSNAANPVKSRNNKQLSDILVLKIY